MKHMTKTLLVLFLGALLALSCGLFVACQPAEPDTPDVPDTPDTPDDPDTPGGDDDEEEESTAGYAGIYTYVVDDPTGEITYSLEILANNDYEMSVTKEFGTFTAIKYYAGPLERVNGAICLQSPYLSPTLHMKGRARPPMPWMYWPSLTNCSTPQRAKRKMSRSIISPCIRIL